MPKSTCQRCGHDFDAQWVYHGPRATHPETICDQCAEALVLDAMTEPDMSPLQVASKLRRNGIDVSQCTAAIGRLVRAEKIEITELQNLPPHFVVPVLNLAEKVEV